MILPQSYNAIKASSEKLGFTMPSDELLGSLLRTLVASKPGGNFLELGTGTGLSLSWIIDGLDVESKIISIENDSNYLEVAKSFYKTNKQVSLICEDAANWLKQYKSAGFDLILPIPGLVNIPILKKFYH